MSTIDLSRQATDLRKGYAGVRMQQGRVLTDDDFNEAALLDAEDMRRTRLDAIGAFGSPDDGFLPKDFTPTAAGPTFTLAAGTLHLGGLRLELAADEPLHRQQDWINRPASEWPGAPPAGQSRTDLVWIEAWQQPVAAVEDRELYEVALGGPDTTARVRTMRRVHILPGVTGSDCPDAWAEALAGWTAYGTLAPDMELRTDARLRVSYTAPPVGSNLCSPATAGGYLGAENQAIRVQMVNATHYTWGFDNAAPLYRVQVSVKNGQRIVLTLQTEPKDAAHWPLKDQTVEILPWSALLPNRERVAELSGHLTRVAVSYNPDDRTLEIVDPLHAGFGDTWTAVWNAEEVTDGSAQDTYLYLRVWNRGDDLASPPAISINNGALGHTGLSVSFQGVPLRANDYWIIAARPAAPDTVTPWILESADGAPPHGLRRYRAPLALIRWSNSGGVVTGELLHDCRPPFLPLTRMRDCCTLTVGDGTHSYGRFTSINAALAALPDTGGRICVLPGEYVESVAIEGLRDVEIRGCGRRSRIIAPIDGAAPPPAIIVSNSEEVRIEALALEAGPRPAVEVQDSAGVSLVDSLVQMRDESGVWPAVLLSGEDLEIRGCVLEVLSGRAHGRVAALADAARGGIQVAGGSSVVHISDNLIVGGLGNGITLGSLVIVDPQTNQEEEVPDRPPQGGPCEDCLPVDTVIDFTPDAAGRVPRIRSAGDLYDIAIEDNQIFRQGANGIGVVRFFGVAEDALDLVTVHGLRIAGNRIVGCLRREVAQTKGALRLVVGYGGITLASVTDLLVTDNLIARNGRDWLDPVCGLFALLVQGLQVERNLIADNGPPTEEPISGARQGIRGGIHVWLALDRVPSSKQMSALFQVSSGGEGLGMRVQDNRIAQPMGRALFLMGAGAMSICDNRLISKGSGIPATDPLAATVAVLNLGLGREWTQELIWLLLLKIYYSLLTDIGKDDAICAYARLGGRQMRPLGGVWPLGKVLFANNQVSFQGDEAPAGWVLSSGLFLSLDDLGITDNQFEFHSDRRATVVDVAALAASLRVNDNRLAETWGRALRSGLTLGLMNTSSDNQSTHCIEAYGVLKAARDNLSLSTVFCPQDCTSWRLLTLLYALAVSGGGNMAFS